MKQVRGFWLPDSEQHLVSFLENGPEFAGGPTYQLAKLLAALPWCKNFRHCADVGGHTGLWSRPLERMFARLTAFEPVAAHRECFERNVPGCTPAAGSRVQLKPFALGDREDTVSLHSGPASSGDTYVKEGGEHRAPMSKLDHFQLTGVDFIKIDTEGYELFVLKGGEQTIRRDKPCIIVEQKPNKGKQFGLGDHDAVTLLKEWGYTVRKEISGDFIMSV